MNTFFKEFQEFAVRGNALDLAVGVVLGAAFNQVTMALATNVLTPPIGLALGGVNFSELVIPLYGKAAIGLGVFLQSILNFVLIALALFVMVKLINRLTSRREKKGPPAPTDSPELATLKQIRDEIKALAKQ